ncbi:MAG TPA: protein kinase [Vicinamibacterales bacterium]|nr:protein kinase [Vicinamibacterales bacterium]
MSDLIASTLGDYKIEALVGQGGIGQVFRGAHVYLGTPVALKVIDGRYASSPGFKTRFVQYAQTITGITHPNLVKVYHCGEQDGLSYVVMELVTGGSLRAIPSDQAWTQASWAAVGLVKQAADGLSAAHARGITHGDIKLANLLLTKPDIAQAQVKVSDLGLLRLVGESGHSGNPDTASRSPVGLDGPAQDIFALGTLLYEMTTGRSPFAGPRDFPAGVPEELKSVILRCLATDPGGRFASCDELSQALATLLEASRALGTDMAVVSQTSSPALALKTAVSPAVSRRGSNPPKPPAPLPPGGPKVPCLHVFDDAGTPVDMQFVRGSGITIGRSASCNIVLSSANVSSTHVRIDWDARRTTVTDLGSANGTLLQGQRLLPQVAQEWGKEQWLQIGSFWLWLQRPGTELVGSNVTEIMLDHSSKIMTITPGKGAVCRLTLVNQKTQVDHVTLSIEGIPDEWVEGTKRDVQLQPFEKREVTLAVNVPKSSAGRAGDYTVTIRGRSAANPEAEPGSVTAHWTVLPFEAMGASITPARSSGRRQARYTVTLHHDGNKPASYVLTGADEDKQLECLFSAEGYVDRNRLQVETQPGTKTNVKLKVAAPKRWFGNSQAYPFNVQATPVDGQQALTTEGQFTHKAIFPIWVMAVVPVLILGLLFVAPRFLKPVLRTVYVEPRSPMVGQKVEIFWDASTATRIRLFVNELPVLPDPEVTAGKYSFPEGFQKDTRVRVLASNLFGESPRDVTVSPLPLPPAPPASPATVELFEVTPLAIVPDGTVTIRWRASGATRVELAPIGSMPVEGSTSHSPPADVTYTLTAFNKENVPTTRTVSVRVRQPTISGPSGLTLTATSREPKKDPLTGRMVVGVGQLVIFRWTAENSAKVRIDAITPVGLEGGSGTKTAELKGEGTYTFTLVATNDKGQEFRSPPVDVMASCKGFPARVITFRFGCNKNPELQWK